LVRGCSYRASSHGNSRVLVLTREVLIMKALTRLVSSSVSMSLAASFALALLLCSVAPTAGAAPLSLDQDRAGRSDKGDKSANERGTKESGRDAGGKGERDGKDGGSGKSCDRTQDGKGPGDRGGTGGRGGK